MSSDTWQSEGEPSTPGAPPPRAAGDQAHRANAAACAATPREQIRPAAPKPAAASARSDWARSAILAVALVVLAVLGAPLLHPWWSPAPPSAPDPLAGLPPEAFEPLRRPLEAQPLMPPTVQAMVTPPAAMTPAASVSRPVTARPPRPAPMLSGKAASVKTTAASRKPRTAQKSDARVSTGSRPDTPAAPLAATTIPAPAARLMTAPDPTPKPVTTPGPAFEVTQVDVKPQLERSVAAQYPDGVRDPAADVVVLRVLIDPAGSPADVRVLRKSRVDPALDRAAVAAVKQWQFSPARKRAQAVSCWYSVGVQLSPPAENGSR